MSVSPSPSNQTMRAAHVPGPGWLAHGTVPEALSLGTVPAPAPPSNTEVLIAIHAASVTADDVAVCQDTAGGGWLMHARAPTPGRPHVGGCDYAGVVLAVGPGVTSLVAGDRVCGVQDLWQKQRPGTWAERTVAGEAEVCRIGDDSVSFVEAAGTAMGAFVCSDMLRRAGEAALTGNGRRALVVGASGGLGNVMVQLLAARGAAPGGGDAVHVTAVCSAANAGAVRALGADEAIDYAEAPLGERLAAGEPFDVVFDFVGGLAVERAATPLLRKGAPFVTAVGPRQNVMDRQLSCCEFTATACGLMGRMLSFFGPKYVMSGDYPPLKQADWDAVRDAGARARVALEVPLQEEPLRKALRAAASHHAGGRVVINMEI